MKKGELKPWNKTLRIQIIQVKMTEEMQENPALEEGAETDEDEYSTDEDEKIDTDDDEELSEREEEISLDEYMDDDEVPDYKTSVNNSSPDDERREIPMSAQSNFQDQLLSQLYQLDLDDREYHIAEQLVGSLDDDGYIRRELSAVVDDLVFAQNISTQPEELEHILKKIQSLDPPGIGARSLQDAPFA